MNNPNKIICIAGATASGKSALAMAIAAEFGGEIINADSMQVYDALPILTAQPTATDKQTTPHHLYGHISPDESYNVARWQADTAATIEAVQGRGRVPIVVGGTGLYFHALTQGLAEIPEIDEAIRQHWRTRLEAEGASALHKHLRTCDPDLAQRLNPNDGQRILRGLEVYEATGQTLSYWQSLPPHSPPSDFTKILLMPPREWLYARCDSRFLSMLEAGAAEEVAAFTAANVSMESPLRKALGVSELLMLQAQLCDAETARLTAQQRTRRYAKRQMTWFRNRMQDWQIFSISEEQKQDYTQNREKIFSFITKNTLT